MARASKFSSRTMTAEDWKTIKHFTPKEFLYPERMGYEFMRWLDNLRDVCEFKFIVSSSVRSEAHNEEVGGASDSAHLDKICNAVDLKKHDDVPLGWNHATFKITWNAMRLGCQRIGIYQDDSIHLDMTHDVRPAPRLWRRV